MIRHCSCGCAFLWRYCEVSDGFEPDSVFHGNSLANCPNCDTTLAEPSGVAFVARYVGALRSVRIADVVRGCRVIDAEFEVLSEEVA